MRVFSRMRIEHCVSRITEAIAIDKDRPDIVGAILLQLLEDGASLASQLRRACGPPVLENFCSVSLQLCPRSTTQPPGAESHGLDPGKLVRKQSVTRLKTLIDSMNAHEQAWMLCSGDDETAVDITAAPVKRGKPAVAFRVFLLLMEEGEVYAVADLFFQLVRWPPQPSIER